MGIRLTLLAAFLMVAVACGDSSSATTTSTEPTPVPTTEAASTSQPAIAETSPGQTESPPAVTTTSAPAFSLPDFTVVERTDEDVLVVAVPPATYNDIDLRNLVEEVVERFAPVNGLHIIDDEAIADLVLLETVTSAEQVLLDEHYFLRLEEGFRMVFVGPFAEVGEVILGS